MKKLFPNLWIIKGKYFEVHQDWEVAIPGFFILAPKRKMHSVMEFTDEEAKEFIILLREVRKAMKKVLKIKEVYLFQNEDSNFYFHTWIFPNYKWMDKFGKGPAKLVPVWRHARDNMATTSIKKEVKEKGLKVREYLTQHKPI